MKKIKRIRKTCKVCGKTFLTHNAKRYLCSPICCANYWAHFDYASNQMGPGAIKKFLAKSIGYRSMGEVKVAAYLQKYSNKNIKIEYEPDVWEYQHQPQRYIPDFVIKHPHKYIYIEYKGKLDSDVRKKLRAVKRCNPDKDLRIIFEYAKHKISKNSKTTYGQWATKNGFPWCDITDIETIKKWSKVNG